MSMNRFTTGMIVGSIVGAVGVMMKDTDKKSRRKMLKSSKKAMRKASAIMDDI